MAQISLKIGVGGYINGELITFDFRSGDKLKPYVCAITGRDFKYVFKREFVQRNDLSLTIKPYGKEMRGVSFKIEPYIVYEYKRFAGESLGEICEGYFVVVRDRIVELDYEEVRHWCGTTKEKMNSKVETRPIFANDDRNYAKEDIDF